MRHQLAKLLIVLLLGAQAGCATIQHLDPVPGVPAPRTGVTDDTIRVVAVRPPELRYEDPVGDKLGEEINESAHLIQVLRRTGLFEEVGFTSAVGCPIDIEDAAVPGEHPPGARGSVSWLNVVTP